MSSYSDDWDNSDEDEQQVQYTSENSVDVEALFDRARDIVDRLQYYSWSRGFDIMTSNHSVDNVVDLIYQSQ